MTEQVGLRAHGLAGNDAEQLVEGMSIQSLEGASQSYFDDMLQSEITIMTSAIPADTSGGGIRMNSVLKDGGNIFSGAAFVGFSSGDWQSNNIDDTLRAAPSSIRTPNGIKHIHMFTGSVGGPIKRDKLWFLVSARHQSSDETVADVPVQITPQGEIISSSSTPIVAGRPCGSPGRRHRITSWRPSCSAGGSARGAPSRRVRIPEPDSSATRARRITRSGTSSTRRRSPTRFFWRAATPGRSSTGMADPTWATSSRGTPGGSSDQTHLEPADDPPALRVDTGCTDWGSSLSQRQDNTRIVFDGRISYVTGSHNLKFGYTHEIGPDGRMANEYNGDLQQTYNNGNRNTVIVWNTPLEAPGRVQYDSALFIQDSWTFNRLTLNPGLRIEWFAAGMENKRAGEVLGRKFFRRSRPRK
jgi:hypothetical protein